MLTSVGPTPFSQAGITQPLYPSVSLQQSYIPPVQLPSTAPILTGQMTPRATQIPSAAQLTPLQFSVATPQLTPSQFSVAAPQLTPRSLQPTSQEILYGSQTPRSVQQPDLIANLQAEGRKLQPQVNNALDRVGQEAQGFFRWLFAPIRR